MIYDFGVRATGTYTYIPTYIPVLYVCMDSWLYADGHTAVFGSTIVSPNGNGLG